MIRVKTLFLRPFINRRNSDYGYFQELAHLSDLQPVELTQCSNALPVAVGNGLYACRAFVHRMPGLRRLVFTRCSSAISRCVWLPRAAQRGSHLIYTNWYFPINRTDIPILLDADFCEFGVPEVRAKVSRLLYVPDWMIERASGILVRHPWSKRAFEARYPRHAGKVRVLPFFHPYLQPISRAQLDAKWTSTQPLRILFTGRQARRKGLPALSAAWSEYRLQHTNLPATLTVVSSFDDGEVSLPKDVRVLRNLTRSQLEAEFRAAHVFVLPTREEAYGRVFIEAVNHGCVLIAPDWEPALHLWGRFGACVPVDSPAAICRSLRDVAADPARAGDVAARGLAYYQHHLAPSVVAQKYYEVFREFANPRA